MLMTIFKFIGIVFVALVLIGGVIEIIHSLIKFSLGLDQKPNDSGSSRRS